MWAGEWQRHRAVACDVAAQAQMLDKSRLRTLGCITTQGVADNNTVRQRTSPVMSSQSRPSGMGSPPSLALGSFSCTWQGAQRPGWQCVGS